MRLSARQVGSQDVDFEPCLAELPPKIGSTQRLENDTKSKAWDVAAQKDMHSYVSQGKESNPPQISLHVFSQ